MKQILVAILLSFAIAAATASAATLLRSAPNPSPAPAPAPAPVPVSAPTPAPAPTVPVSVPAPAPAPVSSPAAPVRPAPVAATAVTTTPVRAVSADTDHWKIYVGAQLGDSIVGGLLGLQINKMYSVEAHYNYVDTLYQPNNTVKSSSAGIAGIVMFPLKFSEMEPFFLYAKAGYERTSDKSTRSDPGIPGIFSPSTTITTTVRKRVMVGAGAQYDFGKSVSGRIGINAIGSDHSVYLAAIYKF